MIFVTGDIHGDPSRLDPDSFHTRKELTKQDCVIICGDFGLCWEKEETETEKFWMDWLSDQPYTTLFVDGNHENFHRLESYPVESWNGGRVQKLRESVIHLMRGEMYRIAGKRIFAFGGARSHDIRGLASNSELKKDYTAGILRPSDPEFKDKLAILNAQNRFTRIEGESWWKEEMPSEEEMQHGLDTFAANRWKADFIISHDGPASVLAQLYGGITPDPLSKYFEEIHSRAKYKYWFFGHHHVNSQITNKDFVVYEQIIRVD